MRRALSCHTRRFGGWSFVWYPVECAMHGAVNIGTPWGYLCVKATTTRYAGLRPWYVYWSPNSTPWAATFAIGPGVEPRDRRLAPLRRALLGWRGVGMEPRLNDTLDALMREVSRG